ncbi:DNA damage-regulated autophagy modulator protein 1-like isoform X1 [Tachypleus tridentatus]|uniref:DNA damage-regulated autophagy modulator protein 1-like isoform X1 n=1 Tax=Tachypleus tridentatus TaxID=6853 RepID=UPI003FD14067
MSLSTWSGLGWLPALTGIFLACGVVVAYIIAVLHGDVTPYMPFISETGTDPPQSGIFSICLFCSGSLGLITMMIRYMFINELNKGRHKKIQITNQISLFCGFTAIGGMMVVAVYPMSTVSLAHDIGAYTLFILGLIYASLQTLVTYYLYPDYNGLTICRFRLTIVLLCLICLVTMVIIYPVSHSEFKSGNYNHPRRLKQLGEKGFRGLVVSSTAEWTLALIFITFFFTYIREFQNILLQIKICSSGYHLDEVAIKQTNERQPLINEQV